MRSANERKYTQIKALYFAGWGEERTPTIMDNEEMRWGSFVTPTYGTGHIEVRASPSTYRTLAFICVHSRFLLIFPTYGTLWRAFYKPMDSICCTSFSAGT
jgi:hypothetical protein